ncbi:MAG: OmpA family protein [Deltaproteobacteria bacterium]|nr:OmpA family protein [Deltaproteobacteria bacterium]
MKKSIFLVLILMIAGCGSSGTGTQNGTVKNGNSSGDQTGGDVNINDGDFGLKAGDAKSAGGVHGSKLRPTATEAVLKLIVVNDKKEPISKVVAKIEGPDGSVVYTPETDATGYTEILIPVGKEYKITYLSLFEDSVVKSTPIPNEPGVTMKLELTYTPLVPAPVDTPDEGILLPVEQTGRPSLILKGVEFDTAKATLKPESFPHLEKVVEFMTYMPSAIIEVSGHTDNKGNAAKNMELSQKRADAVKDYLVSKGIEEDRIIAVGYGQDKPIASNDTEEGRALNRRTEAKDISE